MIKFQKLIARDTFSYTLLDFNFETGLHNIQGVNGSSKTSIFMALIQGLTNRNPKNCKVDAVSNYITGNPYEIEITFSKGSDQFKVINSRKKGNIQVFINGEDKSLKRIPDNLNLIQDILGGDYLMLVDLLYQSKDSTINLLETSTDKGRKEFIARILRLEEIDSLLVRAKDSLKELEGKNGRLPYITSSLELLSATIATEIETEEEVDISVFEAQGFTLEARIEELKQQCKDIKSKIQTLNTAKENKESDIHTKQLIEATLKELSESSTVPDIEAERSALQKAMQELAVKSVFKSTLEQELEVIESQLGKLRVLEDTVKQQKELTLPALSKNELEDKHDSCKETITSLSTTLKQLKTEYDALKNAVEKSGVCPTCGHEGNKAGLEGTMLDLRAKGEAIQNQLPLLKEEKLSYEKSLLVINTYNTLQEKIEKLRLITSAKEVKPQEHKNKIEAVTKEVAELEDLIAKHRKALSEFDARQGKLLHVEKLKNSLKGGYEAKVDYELEILNEGKLLSDLQGRLNGLESEYTSLLTKISSLIVFNTEVRTKQALNEQIRTSNEKIKLQIDSLQKEYETLSEKVDNLKLWVGILGNKGYRVSRIHKFLKSLNATMRKYSEMISGGRIQCTFFVTDTGEVDFTLTDAAKEMPYELWSGGEKSRVKLVCLFSVLELLEVMGSVSFNVICLDEVFSTLDTEGKEGLFKVLEYLRTKGKCIYTIAHEDLALDMVYDSTIKADKLPNGTTRITQ